MGVVLASEGYPGPYDNGKPIDGLDEAAAAGRRRSSTRAPRAERVEW